MGATLRKHATRRHIHPTSDIPISTKGMAQERAIPPTIAKRFPVLYMCSA